MKANDEATIVFTYEDISAELDQYLSNIPISVDDPALLFVWNLNDEALTKSVEHANAVRADQRGIWNPPAWLTVLPPNITKSSLIDDIVTRLALHAGGRCQNVMLAPNTIIQFGILREALVHIETDPFIQHCMQQVQAGVFLAKLFVLTDRTVARAVPSQHLAPVAPLRQVFQ